MAENDTQAQALIDALVPKLTEALLPQLQDATEKQIAGVLAKNEQILGKLVDSKVNAADLKSQVEALLAKGDTPAPKPREEPQHSGDVIIRKEDARDPRAYARAKAEAQQRGVQVRFEGRNDAA